MALPVPRGNGGYRFLHRSKIVINVSRVVGGPVAHSKTAGFCNGIRYRDVYLEGGIRASRRRLPTNPRGTLGGLCESRGPRTDVMEAAAEKL